METVADGQGEGSSGGLPEWLRNLFWDHDFSVFDWRQDRELVMRQAGDAAVRDTGRVVFAASGSSRSPVACLDDEPTGSGRALRSP
jgi:hypothetical protein